MKIAARFLLGIALIASPAVVQAADGPVIGKTALKPQVTVRAVPTTAGSKPFHTLGALPAKYGYVEEEFFISGVARAYEWDGATFGIRAISAPGPYTVRILVLRPSDSKKFSGNAEVELLNSSRGFDGAAMLSSSADLIMQRGDVYVGLTSKGIALDALKRLDPKRYADLVWSNPVPEAKRCATPSIFPLYITGGVPTPGISSSSASEDGLIYDIYAQLGALLKSDQRSAILPGFARPRLFSSGTSQSGMLQRTYLNAFHPVMRLPNGGPIYDGYLVEVGAGVLRINQCSTDIRPGDKRNLIRDIDVPVVNIISEGDMHLGLHTRQPDMIKPRSGIVSYEVAAGFHGSGMFRASRPSDSMPRPLGDEARARGMVISDFPRGYVSRVGLIHLQKWAIAGKAPPVAKMLQTRGDEIVRDADGNAIGGVRSVWVDVPVAGYSGTTGPGTGTVVGGKIPFAADKVRQLYPTRESYVAKVKANVAQSVAKGWLLAEDAETVIATVTKVPDSYWSK